jgi:predicted amidophosphoribosyltransferase
MRCKKLYTSGTLNLCTACAKELDECVRTIGAYLDEHPRANIKTISEETEVSERDIQYLLRTERLQLVNTGLVCDKCGTPINSGRYCNKCRADMEKEFTQVAKDMEQKSHSESEARNKRISEEKLRSAAQKMQVLYKYKDKEGK